MTASRLNGSALTLKMRKHCLLLQTRTNGCGKMVQKINDDSSFDEYGAIQDGGFKGIRPAVWVSIG